MKANIEKFTDLIKTNEPFNCYAQACFIGENGSLGYLNGQVYVIKVRYTPRTDKSDGTPEIVIFLPDGRQYCPYTSPSAFLDNWAIIDIFDQ